MTPALIVKAEALWRAEASRDLVAATDALVANGSCSWAVDPFVPGVVGLLNAADRALVIVYVNDRDFECDEATLLAVQP